MKPLRSILRLRIPEGYQDEGGFHFRNPMADRSPRTADDARAVASDDSKRPMRNITRDRQRDPSQCEHQYEVIAREEDGALKRCVKCRNLEAE